MINFDSSTHFRKVDDRLADQLIIRKSDNEPINISSTHRSTHRPNFLQVRMINFNSSTSTSTEPTDFNSSDKFVGQTSDQHIRLTFEKSIIDFNSSSKSRTTHLPNFLQVRMIGRADRLQLVGKTFGQTFGRHIRLTFPSHLRKHLPRYPPRHPTTSYKHVPPGKSAKNLKITVLVTFARDQISPKSRIFS
jgi:hypothetical protein